MASPHPYLPDDRATALVLDYLPGDSYSVGVIPKLVRPALLVALLQAEIQATTRPRAWWRAMELVAYYGLREVLGHFTALFETTGPDAEGLSRAAVLVAMLGWTGDDGQRAFAARQFDQHLLSHPAAAEALAMLLQCWNALGPALASGHLRAVAERHLAEIDARQAVSEPQYIASQNLRRFINNDLWRAEAAMTRRRQIAGLDRDGQRRQAMRIYCGLEPDFAEHLLRWAVYWLLADARNGAGPVIAEGFSGLLAEVEQATGPDDATRRFRRTRTLRAIELFDPVRLSIPQRAFLTAALAQGQDDLLSVVQPDQGLRTG